MVNNNKCFDIFFRCIFLFSILLLVSIFVKAYITKKNKKEAFFNYKTGHTCTNTNSGGTANWGYGLRAFHIGAAGPANNNGEQIMSWDHNRIKNQCKKIAESRFGKTGYSGISVHHTGPWHTRGCDIYHKQTKPIETIPYSGKNCYINPNFVPKIKGCTNPSAYNYNNNANYDDGSCKIRGCMQDWADNYNSYANENDNSCYKRGCKQSWADNYDNKATIDDNSCYKRGCNKSWADNYDNKATIDDNSCYKRGCKQSWADNYDNKATIDDNSCYKKGCKQSWADNYDEKATIDNNSCYKKGCKQSWADNYDKKVTIDNNSCSKKGCNKSWADNYDKKATIDDNSCYKKGCTDPNSDNYDQKANLDDNSCYIKGCMDSEADNYNRKANKPGKCDITGCMDSEANNYNPKANKSGKCDIIGCMDSRADNYNPKANVSDSNSCKIKGCMDKDAKNFNKYANINNGCEYYIYGCMKNDADNYNPNAEKSDGFCIYKGCTNPLAKNYSKKANYENNSCEILGCTDKSANNYSEHANIDDNTCEYTKYGCTDKDAVNYGIESDSTITKCIFASPVQPVLPPEQPIPESKLFTKNNCEIKYETGFCVMNNEVAPNNKTKIDDIDVGLNSADRNIECYKKAKDQFGNRLTGVELISGRNNSGCYAHTSDQIFKANAANNHICHIVAKHHASQYCKPDNLSVINDDVECESIIQKKNMLNEQQESFIKKIKMENEQLDKLIENYKQNNKNKEIEYSINMDEFNARLKERYDILDSQYNENNKYIDEYNCSAKNVIKLQEVENKNMSLIKEYELYKLQNEYKRNEANEYELINLRYNREIKDAEYRKQIQEQKLENDRKRGELQKLMDSNLVKQQKKAQKLEEQRQAQFLEEKRRKLAEIAVIEELKRQKEYEIINRKKLLMQERIKSLEEAQKIAKSKEQIEALENANKNAVKALKGLEHSIQNMIKKHRNKRQALKKQIRNIKYKQDACADNIDQVLGAKGKEFDDLKKCTKFNIQMQKIQPVYF